MTLEEKIQLVHGGGYAMSGTLGNGGGGFVPGIARLGLPDLNMADSTVGVTRGAARSRYSTLMPASIGEAAAWSPALSYDYGALIGRELRAQGYNVSLAGGANLMREPRNGRTFEYRGEDPLLTGKLTAQAIRGLQDQKVIGDPEALCAQRPGNRAQRRQRADRLSGRARKRLAGVRDRREGRRARHGHVLVQQAVGRLGVRE